MQDEDVVIAFWRDISSSIRNMFYAKGLNFHTQFSKSWLNIQEIAAVYRNPTQRQLPILNLVK